MLCYYILIPYLVWWLMKVCSLCSTEKDDSEFHQRGKQCKRCLANRCLERYYSTDRARRITERQQKDAERKSHIVSTTPTERAYAAGLIDGEGCIGITRRGVGGGEYAVAHQSGQHGMAVWVSNTARPMLEFLHSRWGGSVTYRKPFGNSREQWCWTVQANKALHFLDDIYEFLIVKRRQAQLARRFQRYVQVPGRVRTEKIYRVQSHFFDVFKVLNSRGIVPRVRPKRSFVPEAQPQHHVSPV